jgi:methionyl-tRNA formyltransferase
VNILFLTSKEATGKHRVTEILKSRDDNVNECHAQIDVSYLERYSIDLIFSDRYPHILQKEVIDFVEGRAINVHPSLLPLNKGVQPLFFSIYNGTKTGVSIHYMTEELDSGDIISQEELFAERDEKLTSLYIKSRNATTYMLSKHWNEIRNFKMKGQKQKGAGTMNYKKDFERLFAKLPMKWSSSVNEVRNLR